MTMVRDAVVADREARVTKADLDAAISGLESRLMARMGTFEARMDTFATKAELAALEISALRRGSRRRRGQRPHRGRTQGALTSLARRAACRFGTQRASPPRST